MLPNSEMKALVLKTISISILIAMASLYSPETLAQTEQNSKAADEKVYEGKDVDSKVKILSMPDPVYTFQAAREHVVGVVRLRAVFAASGEIKNIQVVNGLPAGLTENAIEVARKITFTPAMKDGHPVSQQTLLVYKFELMERVIHGQRFPKLFYDESCRDYFNIASENMVFFTSEKEAKKAGYKKSKTCP
jgi:TonB family protein